MKKKIAIVVGEPRSINSEIICKAWKRINNNLKNNILFIGSFNLLKTQAKKIDNKIKINKIIKFSDFSNNQINILDVYYDKKNNSKYVLDSLTLAHNLSIKKKIIGFINCPIDKKIFKEKIGVKEYLSNKNKLKKTSVMMIYNKNFSVVPITTHINVSKISKSLNQKLIIDKVTTLSGSYLELFKKQPKIAVLGLNPHNDEMRTDSEEIKIIMPSIKKLKDRKINVHGPFSTDSIFLTNNYKKYDVVVGMYHDQVLGPFKALFGLDAINITLGLKYFRSSPDHGTAKELIGKNLASPISLINAINFANKFKC